MSKDGLQGARWILGCACERTAETISRELGLCRITARVLVRRGISSPEEARRFLCPSLGEIPDPFSLPGMSVAASRLAEAVRGGERIAIFGDYDADGIAGVALICEFLRAVGATPAVKLPDRRETGYGITPRAVEEFASEGARLILTVDNGIGAIDAAVRAGELGVDLIVTDHHAIKGELPRAHSIVNPKLIEDKSPSADLAGCGVAFMLAAALRRKLREEGLLPDPEPNLRRSLDLVALGTIADVVPLTGTNRILTSHGLREIALTQRPGVRALLEVSGTAPEAVTPQAVAFRLAPRINAAGRLGDPAEALKLLLARNLAEAKPAAERLDDLNRERQRIEKACLGEALESIGVDRDTLDAGAVVVDSDRWHIGVIGIMASKLASRFGRPAIVISRETSPARGSGRSGGRVNLLKALTECEDAMVRFGGHADAAGLSVEESRIEELRERFAAACASQSDERASPPIEVDAELEPHEIGPRLVDELAKLAPFGVGNPEPLFALAKATVTGRRIVGKGHLKLALTAGGFTFDAIGFGMAEMLPEEVSSVDLAFTPEHNTYNGITSLQLKLKEVVPNLP